MNENQNTQEENLAGKQPEPIAQTQANESSTTQPEKEMEVHHHGHVHEKKKWKEYGFQFLMLFLALALGYGVEKIREHQVEKSMEKEYIESLITDVESDRDLIKQLRDSIYKQVKKIDTLQTLFGMLDNNSENKDSIIKKCYQLSVYIGTYYPVNFNQTTITSLLSSGNLRLIKATDAANNILVYYNTIKNAEEQKKLYHDYLNKCLESMYNVYDVSLLRTRVVHDSLIPPTTPGTHFLTTETIEFKKLNATMERAKIAAFFLINRISEIRAVAIELLDFLDEAYKK